MGLDARELTGYILFEPPWPLDLAAALPVRTDILAYIQADNESVDMNVRSVAVIGAGPAGAAAADALAKEQRFETVRVFDRRSLAGGTW